MGSSNSSQRRRTSTTTTRRSSSTTSFTAADGSQQQRQQHGRRHQRQRHQQHQQQQNGNTATVDDSTSDVSRSEGSSSHHNLDATSNNVVGSLQDSSTQSLQSSPPSSSLSPPSPSRSSSRRLPSLDEEKEQIQPGEKCDDNHSVVERPVPSTMKGRRRKKKDRRNDHNIDETHGGPDAADTASRRRRSNDDVDADADTQRPPPPMLSAEQRILERIRQQQQQDQQEQLEEEQEQASNNNDDNDNNSNWGPPIYTPVVLTSSEDEEKEGKDEVGRTSVTNEGGGDVSYYSASDYYYCHHTDNPDQQLAGQVRDDPQQEQVTMVSTVNYLTPATAAPVPDFFPQGSRHYEWMGRSLETLILGYSRVFGGAPILSLPDLSQCDDDSDPTHYLWGAGAVRRRSTVSTLGSNVNDFGRRSSLESVGHGRRGSLVHGGTLANYYSSNRRRDSADSTGRRDSNNSGSATGTGPFNRRGSTAGGANVSRRGSASHGPGYRRRRIGMSRSPSNNSDSDGVGQVGGSRRNHEGPNIVLSLLAREATGRLSTKNLIPASNRLRTMSPALFGAIDRPACGMCSEVQFLNEIIDSGDWPECQAVISRIAPRLIGDPSNILTGTSADRRVPIDDPNLPPNAPRFYAGGGRLGMERDGFVNAGGIDVLIRIFREPRFVGAEMSKSFDARDLSEEFVIDRLAQTWAEAMICLRELVYSMPSLVEDEDIFGDGDFVPFLFTLMWHDSCFDAAASLLEEIFSLQSHPQQSQSQDEDVEKEDIGPPINAQSARNVSPKTFFLGNVPDLYSLLSGFNCRQLAHFCRILALLVFEPEDRSLLESPTVLKSVDLLRLRRNRAARSGRDSTIDMNQSILLSDDSLLERLLQLLSIMNFGPTVRDQGASFHTIARYPYIANTLTMVGLYEFDDWEDVFRTERLARKSIATGSNGLADSILLGDLGSVDNMLRNLSQLMDSEGNQTNQLGLIISVISAAQAAGVVPSSSPRRSTRLAPSHEGNVHENESRISTPSGAANLLQYNSIALYPYQVEILFVLCTLLGGRRKIDAQETLLDMGVVSILNETFERLPWDSLSPTRKTIKFQPPDRSDSDQDDSGQQQYGPHGEGCACTPESANCVQYLRLLHNLSDRDCDNYKGRRLFLSIEERNFIFESETSDCEIPDDLSPGLLSKLITAFIGEADESPYRFWLASCIESYLRGSSDREQLFVAKTGLMEHLLGDVTSQRLFCSGSLQTSFDLLGELCKGDLQVLNLLVEKLDEARFQQLMTVAAENLVDSNVFVRSLLLSIERVSAANNLIPPHLFDDFGASSAKWKSSHGLFSRSYLTHSWWDTLQVNADGEWQSGEPKCEFICDVTRPTDWFPTSEAQGLLSLSHPTASSVPRSSHALEIGHSGWVLALDGDKAPSANTIERISWFLSTNRARLLHELLKVVNLPSINHENICVVNTAVVICIFAHRRKELHILLADLQTMSEKERYDQQVMKTSQGIEDSEEAKVLEGIKDMNLHGASPRRPNARKSSLRQNICESEPSTGKDALQNFREVLWFWKHYYSHRGRDRLSLEFSSRVRFCEWIEVVSLLSADNGTPTSLVKRPISLPRSPYCERAA